MAVEVLELSLREVEFCYHRFAKNKNILYTVLHSDDLILIKTILWDLWFWLSIWAEGTMLPSYLIGRGFVMRHLLCFWSKYLCDKCCIKTHKDMNNPVFSEEFKLHAINKTKATHWLKKVKKEILNSSVHPAHWMGWGHGEKYLLIVSHRRSELGLHKATLILVFPALEYLTFQP